MDKRISKIELITDGRKIITEGKEIELKINNLPVYDNSAFNSFVNVEKMKQEDFETLDVFFLMNALNAIFGHPDRYKIALLLRKSSKTFTQIQQELKLKPATLDFHMKKLLCEMIVNKTVESKGYELTIIGEAVLDHFVSFLKAVRKPTISN
jgi:DNA-binding transcriptional ArsR family regulator